MISLISKESSQIDFPVTSQSITSVQSNRPHELIIESGVAVISFRGQNSTDWTRDGLSFPVGKPTQQRNFLSGIASASPASFWTNPSPLSLTPGLSSEIVSGQVTVEGSGPNGPIFSSGNVSLSVPVPVYGLNGNIPDIGCAVDSATVAYSTQVGQPVANLALAVFGISTFLLRIAYTVHILLGDPGISVVGNR